MTQIENRISLGNILSMATVVLSVAATGVTLALWGGKIDQDRVYVDLPTGGLHVIRSGSRNFRLI